LYHNGDILIKKEGGNMEKKITLFHGSEKIIEYQTYLEMMDDETDGIYINKASAESLYKISKVLGCAMEDLLEK
jgi:hypothetical protein